AAREPGVRRARPAPLRHAHGLCAAVRDGRATRRGLLSGSARDDEPARPTWAGRVRQPRARRRHRQRGLRRAGRARCVVHGIAGDGRARLCADAGLRSERVVLEAPRGTNQRADPGGSALDFARQLVRPSYQIARLASALGALRLALPLDRLARPVGVAALAAAATARTPAAGTAAARTPAAGTPAGTRGLRVGHLDGDTTPVELAAVELRDRVLRLLRRAHLHEPEPARLAREPVRYDGG